MKKTARYLGIILVIVLTASIVMLFSISAGAATTVQYVDASGESQVISNVTSITGTIASQTLNEGWYVMSGTVSSSSTLTCNGDVNIIIADGATVTVGKIFVPYGSSVTIYGQQQQSGKLTVNSGIGASTSQADQGMGDITINGGIIEAKGDDAYVAIGTNEDVPANKSGNITINGGTVSATNDGWDGAIGYHAETTATITINGGNITAKSGRYGGNRAYGAGIGGEIKFGGIVINGGNLDVFGDAVGIGGTETPITINGGRIKVSTSLGGAAIGSPSNDESGLITITGGYIEATVNDTEHYQSAIGSGAGGSATGMKVTGGTIIVYGGSCGLGGNSYYGGNDRFDFVLTGGSIYLTNRSNYRDEFLNYANLKNAEGQDITVTPVELTLTGSGDGTKITSMVGSDHGINDVETVGGTVKFYMADPSALPTKIYTDKGLYMPESEGSTTYALHDVHTVEPTYTPNADDHEKHDKFYSCCDELIVEGHHFSAGSYDCSCGLHAVAEVDGKYFVNFDNALRFAQEDGNSVITLHADATVVDDINVSGNLTLDLNGNALVTSDKYMYALYLRSGSLTLKDSDVYKSGSVSANSAGVDTIGVERGNLTVESGIYGKIAVANGDSITVNGGTIRELSVTSGNLVINGGEFAKITAPAELQTTLGEDLFFYNSENVIVDASAITEAENVTVKYGADLVNSIATLEYAETNYTNLAKEPTFILNVFGSEVKAEHFDVVFANNTLPGEATVTVMGKGIYSGENTFTFIINKGNLVVVENPTATHEFGDIYSDKAITGGKVVIEGNEEEIITGTWTWVDGAPKATFVPDAEYEGLFEELNEEYDVNVVVTPSLPVITINSPVSALIPGVNAAIGVEAKNVYDESVQDLPTDYRIIYRIGEDGEEITVDGLEFVLPNDVKMGDKVYLRVENIAVDGKYSVSTSTNTIEFTVGQVDHSSDIDELGATISELNATVEELKEALEAANAGKAALEKADTDLNAVIAQQSEDITAVKEENEALKEALEAANADKAALEKADADMSAVIVQQSEDITAVKEENEALKATLEQMSSDMEQLSKDIAAAKDSADDSDKSSDTSNDKGCGSTIGMGVIGIVAIAGACLISIKKKET